MHAEHFAEEIWCRRLSLETCRCRPETNILLQPHRTTHPDSDEYAGEVRLLALTRSVQTPPNHFQECEFNAETEQIETKEDLLLIQNLSYKLEF